MFNLKGPQWAEPEDHFWSADHSLRNADVDHSHTMYSSGNIDVRNWFHLF